MERVQFSGLITLNSKVRLDALNLCSPILGKFHTDTPLCLNIGEIIKPTTQCYCDK